MHKPAASPEHRAATRGPSPKGEGANPREFSPHPGRAGWRHGVPHGTLSEWAGDILGGLALVVITVGLVFIAAAFQGGTP